nr:hypothetical protein DBT41_16010 [Aerococcus urinae]
MCKETAPEEQKRHHGAAGAIKKHGWTGDPACLEPQSARRCPKRQQPAFQREREQQGPSHAEGAAGEPGCKVGRAEAQR